MNPFQNQIEEEAKAREIIRRYQNTAPVDVKSAAMALGLAVYSSSLGQKISGILRKDEEFGGSSGYVVLVNNSHGRNRQRFTVAHEIGHFVLHRNHTESPIQDDEFYRALPGPLETQANRFAADILMPWNLVNQLQNQGITDLADMSERLQVSRQALAIRLGLVYDQDWS